MKKHVFRWLAALAVLLPCLLISASASPEYSQAGMCGDNLYWEYTPHYIYGPEGYPVGDGTGSLRIYGTGDMYDYSSLGETPWYMEITGASTELPPEDGGDPTVDYERLYHILTGISIENGVTSIGNHAFEGLRFVSIPQSVTRIGDYAFYKHSGSFMGIPDGVITIGAYAFAESTELTSVIISDSVTTIGISAFQGCTNLTNVTLGKNISSIGGGAFYRCTSLTDVTIPDSVTTIGDSAFQGCTNLTDITIPSSVTTIGEYAFASCDSLTSITVNANNSNYSSLNGVLFNKNQSTLICCPAGKAGAYTVPNSVTTIDQFAFYGSGLTDITVPDSVTTIGNGAFEGCSNLTSITFGSSVTNIGFGACVLCPSLSRVEFLGNAPVVQWILSYDSDNLSVYYHEGTTGWTDSEYYDADTETWYGLPLVMIPAESGGEQEDTYFEVDEYKAAGTAPIQADKVFAGWYTDNTFGQAHTAATGSAHAKFVNKDVLKVKAQVTAGTTAQSELADIRFVTTVDSLKYKKVGFKITFGGETVTQETTTVYSSIVSNTDGVEVNYTPSDEFHADSKYFVTMVLKDVPNEHFDDTFTVTPYWVTQDGTTVEGVTNELRVSMGY